MTITRTPPPGYTCAGGTSDGTGHVAVAALIAGAPASWQVYAADGKARKAFDAWPVMPEPEGWQGLVVKPSTGANGGNLVQHAAFAADGSAGASTVVSWDPTLVGTTLWNASPDPLGGCLVVVAGIDLFHNHWSGLRAQRFDASGAPRWSTAGMFGARSDRILFLGGGVSRAGESLAIWQHSAWLDVSWFDASGTSLGESDFTERSDAVLGSNALQHDIDLVPLLDGGLAVHADGAFRSVYAHLATASAPLPSWLADHATWTYRFTRGNAGYALFPPPGQDSADCSQAIELYAPSGRRCGRVALHGDGRSCSTGSVDQGWDGTVVQQEAAGACTYRFWPGLLAKP
ncbi:hypothetical protein [Anaeromyxobacter oryzae]|uniref:Uncharacterized protein n=1 Tax=Anaeromyxobacter oryzae TaxID=2918170 RepID=A0ABN6MWH7_9BACT|nr:hypothetical protein [Anaeromyxobacter oryzae]BDG05349.1 hypothetical protein AMOR_43450 [Anaeromyxobacter oryzae]